MATIEVIGCIAALLTFSTFYMKTMSTLRVFGIVSNIAFISYGTAIGAYPIIILHVSLLPLNVLRLYQVIKLGRDVKKFSSGEFLLEWIIPYAERRTFRQGDMIFHKGDHADKLYFLLQGKIHITELNKTIAEGALFGEMGLFRKSKQRFLLFSVKLMLLSMKLKKINSINCITSIPRLDFTSQKSFLIVWRKTVSLASQNFLIQRGDGSVAKNI